MICGLYMLFLKYLVLSVNRVGGFLTFQMFIKDFGISVGFFPSILIYKYMLKF
jgi:hypothetical protein